jgi:hypothetical protein
LPQGLRGDRLTGEDRTMGEVIAFRRKPSLSAPTWRRRLMGLWLDEANWRTVKHGARHFTYGRLLVIIHPYELEDDGSQWGWSFIVYSGHGAAAHSEWAWCFREDALDAAWLALVGALETRERATR